MLGNTRQKSLWYTRCCTQTYPAPYSPVYPLPPTPFLPRLAAVSPHFPPLFPHFAPVSPCAPPPPPAFARFPPFPSVFPRCSKVYDAPGGTLDLGTSRPWHTAECMQTHLGGGYGSGVEVVV